jgi:hypothetical protein
LFENWDNYFNENERTFYIRLLRRDIKNLIFNDFLKNTITPSMDHFMSYYFLKYIIAKYCEIGTIPSGNNKIISLLNKQKHTNKQQNSILDSQKLSLSKTSLKNNYNIIESNILSPCISQNNNKSENNVIPTNTSQNNNCNFFLFNNKICR